MEWILSIWHRIVKFIMANCLTLDQCLDEIESNLGIELSFDEERLVADLMGAGFCCADIYKFIRYQRRKLRLRRLLRKEGLSNSDIEEILDNSASDLRGDEKVDSIADKNLNKNISKNKNKI